MTLSKETILKNLKHNSEVNLQLLTNKEFLESFDLASAYLVDAILDVGHIYIAGNGGSAADAQHFAAEFVGRYCKDRIPLPAEALTTDTSLITAIANDYDYSQIFVRQLQTKMHSEDVFVAISTSGNSPNIIKALEYTKASGLKSILLTGNDGGKAKELADISIIVPSDVTSAIQQSHIVIYHSLIESLEKILDLC